MHAVTDCRHRHKKRGTVQGRVGIGRTTCGTASIPARPRMSRSICLPVQKKVTSAPGTRSRRALATDIAGNRCPPVPPPANTNQGPAMLDPRHQRSNYPGPWGLGHSILPALFPRQCGVPQE